MELKGTKNMSEGNYKKNIIYFAIPIMLSQLFQQLYNSADSYIVGKYLGCCICDFARRGCNVNYFAKN